MEITVLGTSLLYNKLFQTWKFKHCILCLIFLVKNLGITHS